MTIRFASAIVLAALVLVCVILARIALKRRQAQRKPRGRDYTPKHIQERRKVMAALRRVSRGLRFPSLQEKEDHRRFVKLLKRHANATGHNQFNQLRKLAKEGNAVTVPPMKYFTDAVIRRRQRHEAGRDAVHMPSNIIFSTPRRSARNA